MTDPERRSHWDVIHEQALLDGVEDEEYLRIIVNLAKRMAKHGVFVEGEEVIVVEVTCEDQIRILGSRPNIQSGKDFIATAQEKVSATGQTSTSVFDLIIGKTWAALGPDVVGLSEQAPLLIEDTKAVAKERKPAIIVKNYFPRRGPVWFKNRR